MKPVIGSALSNRGLRTPRTLGEAFGPAATYRGLVNDHERADRLIGRVCALVLAIGVIALLAERFA